MIAERVWPVFCDTCLLTPTYRVDTKSFGPSISCLQSNLWAVSTSSKIFLRQTLPSQVDEIFFCNVLRLADSGYNQPR